VPIHASGHGVFVNALALAQSTIYPDTPNPAGGEIVRDSQGNPTGMLHETAQDVARTTLAVNLSKRPIDVIDSERRRQVKLAAEKAIANGITSFHDMGETFQTIDLKKI
jgi:predicted amidohydrolase YtcJ